MGRRQVPYMDPIARPGPVGRWSGERAVSDILLGKLEPVDPRQAWSSEGGHFTPWLARPDNIALLGEAIGLELEVEAQEKNVGPFRADILCRNTIDASWVLIENQLERTDHTHLGQLLTYAAGLEAVTIIWVARTFTEEHRAALDWLNRATNEKINFFGLEIELWRIGSSPLAPKFNVVSKPNDWSQTVSDAARGIESGEVTPTKQLQLQFWTQLREYAQQRKTFLKFQKPLPQHWTTLAIGRSDFFLVATVNMQAGEVSAQLVLNSERAKAEFKELESAKPEIERQAAIQFEWRELANKRQSRIETRRSATPTDQSSWPELFKWLVDRLELIHKTFGSRVKALKVTSDLDDSLGRIDDPGLTPPG